MAHQVVGATRQLVSRFTREQLAGYDLATLARMLREARDTLVQVARARDAWTRANWEANGQKNRFAWAEDPVFVDLSEVWVNARDQVWLLEHAILDEVDRVHGDHSGRL